MNDLKGIIEDVEKSSLVSDKVIKRVIEIIGQEKWQDINDEEDDTCTTTGELIITLKNIEELEKSCDETQELLDKQIEATYKLYKENAELKAQIEKMKEVIIDLLWFEDNLDTYMYECDDAQNGELLKPFTNARETLKDCICKKCKGEGIVRVGYNGCVKNPCPICKGRGYVIRSN